MRKHVRMGAMAVSVVAMLGALEAVVAEDVGFEVSPLSVTVPIDPVAEGGNGPLIEFEYTITNKGSEPKTFPRSPGSIVPIALTQSRALADEPMLESSAEEVFEVLEPGESFSGSLQFRLGALKRGGLVARSVEGSTDLPAFALWPGRRVPVVFFYRSPASDSAAAAGRWTGSVFSEVIHVARPAPGEGEAEVAIGALPGSGLDVSLGVDSMSVVAPPPGEGRLPSRASFPLEYTLSNRSGAAMNVITEYGALVPFLISAEGRLVDLDSGADSTRRIVPEDIERLKAGESFSGALQIDTWRRSEEPTGGFGHYNTSGMWHGARLDPGRYFLVFCYWPSPSVAEDDWGASPEGTVAAEGWWTGVAFSQFIEFDFSNGADGDGS